MIQIINSRTNKKVVHASKLKTKNGIKEFHEFLIEGHKALELAIKSGLVKEVFTTKELDLPDNIPQYLVSEQIIDKISFSMNPNL